MSVNGAAIGNSGKLNFCDFDGVKKRELERRKKLRLEQVRTQSKEMSMQIRDRVAREKHRQLRKVEEIKKKELLSWKEQHVNNTMADYYYCLSNVGDAHVAAERENQLSEQVDEQQRENRKIAVMRGRKALEKERLKNIKKNERVKRKPRTNLVPKNMTNPPIVSEEENDKTITNADVIQLTTDSDDESIVDYIEPTHDSPLQSPAKIRKEQANKQKEMVRFSQLSDLIEERRRARNLCDQIMENALITSKPETISKSPEPRTKTPPEKLLCAAKSPKHITKSPAQKSPVNVRGFIPKSHQRVDKATANKLNFNSQRSVAANTKKVNTPNKVVKSKNSLTTAKFVSPQRREFVPQFTKNPTAKPGILKNKAVPVITEAAKTESPEKVQLYDHFCRYGKEYDAPAGMVIRESQPPHIDANEAARVQNEMDEIRFRQLQELRQKTEQRCKDSLQKNQVRKDYENLTKELDKLCEEENRLRTFAMPNEQFSEERISQLARNRQQNMNRAFEDMYHKPVVITCPPIGSNQNCSSSDVNVAASSSPDHQRQRIDPLDSSDSCTSILLGYVDNRSRKLVKDIEQCKDDTDGDKRKKLVTLLTRLDDLRKLLMEEIVRNSSLNLEPFYRSVLEVETEKIEILNDPDANKENMKKRAELLKKREHNVKTQEMKLEKKIAQLFLKEQGKTTEPADDNTFESVTSETITSTVDHCDPVKILIEVKNAGKIRKSHHPKKVHVVGLGSQHKTSVGSTASTAYRSPPRTFETDFTKVLSQQATATAKSTNVPTKATTMSKPVQQTPLAHYIQRLLGMSQQSIDQLGVSTSSSIATPSDSVIDVAENMSTSVIDRNHLNRVQMKINENLQFSREVDDSFKKPKKPAEVKNAAKKVRDSKEQEDKMSKERQNQTKKHQKNPEQEPKKLHPDFTQKLPEKTKKMANKIQQTSDSIDQAQEAVIQPSIPENSQRIIADLAKQIERVRQDKQKLLEKTLSSAHSSSHSSSGKDFDSTQYKDFISSSKSKPKPEADDRDCSSQASDVISLPHFVEEEAKNLINAKQIGISVSRDSGIGSSRPVTSTDFRVSPDFKLTEKPTILQASKVINSDLPERIDPSAGPADTNGKSVESTFIRKSAKPPISLKRFSPQLDTEQLQPHDLSTIVEVETSAASRFNQSTRNETSDISVPVPYAKFPTFVEYAKMQEISSIDTSSDGEKSYSETVLKKMLEVTCLSETDLNYRKLDKSHPKNKTNEKSTNTETGSEFIDVEKEIRQRRLMRTDDLLSSSTNEILSTSTSSDLLAKDFNRIGLNWASAMLKKTSNAQNLESSSSSIKSASIVATKNKPTSGDSSPDDRINGNPLNIRDFLARELLKRTQLSSSSSLSDNSTLTDQFLKSLLAISSNSSFQNQATLRTSTPNRNMSSESEKHVAACDIGHTTKDEHLFSGESILSSVRGGMSQSETSGAKETSE